MQPSDEIKARLDVVDVIREYIQLKPAGMNFRANCPFHNEKTPSFMVSPEKQIWHCFGCGKGGDLISFVMEMEGLTFPEALRTLAPRAGVTLKKTDSQIDSKRNRLLDILELSAEFFHKALLESPEAKNTSTYLKARGLKKETVEAWQIGYSYDSWDKLLNYLKKKGFDENEIFMAGMATRKEQGGGFYDRFRGRIMFPIKDLNGNPVGFSARVSPEREATEKMGKYINSPQTLIYDKSRILFGLDKAKMEIKKKNQAVIVEGQMDAVSAHQAGFLNTIASSGTALTRDQVIILKRYTENLALAFDSDQAGEQAADRGAREALAAEMNISVIAIPSGKDPDECIRKDPEEWKGAVEAAKPLMEYIFDRTFSRLDPEKPAERREAAKIFMGAIARLGNKIEEDIWLRKLCQKIDISENILRETLLKIKDKENRREEKRTPVRRTADIDAIKSQAAKRISRGRKELLSELLLTLILKFPQNIESAVAKLELECLGEEFRPIYSDLIIYYNNIGKELIFEADQNDLSRIFYEDFKSWLSDRFGPEKTSALDQLSLLGERDYYNLEAEEARREILRVCLELRKGRLAGRLREVEKRISEAETSLYKDPAQKDNLMSGLLKEFKTLVEEKKEMEN